MYGITADELHERIVADLHSYCSHHGIPTERWENHHERPLEQTIRLVCELRITRVTERLQAIVDKLPKCWRLKDGKLVQDVPVVPGMDVWICLGHGHSVQMLVVGVLIDNRVTLMFHSKHRTVEQAADCYSTREAAEAVDKLKQEEDDDAGD